MIPLTTTPGLRPKLKVPLNGKAKRQQLELVSYLIEHKKTVRKRFKERVRMFFTLGLFISLGLVVMLFEWKLYDKESDAVIEREDIATQEILDIPVTVQPPPPPPQVVQQPNIIEVPEQEILEEIKVDFDVEVTEEQAISQPMDELEDMIEEEQPEEEVADEIFIIVEDPPAPIGGMSTFLKFVAENIKYPSAARRLGIEGKVFVEFVVNVDGSLTDFKVVKGIGGGCDEEALRVLKMAPKWKPGKQRGQPVRVRMLVPIYFVLKLQ